MPMDIENIANAVNDQIKEGLFPAITVMQKNRIEELEAKLAKAEADLAKAVETLEGVMAFVLDLEPYADQDHTLVPALRKVCTTLAELKGQNNE